MTVQPEPPKAKAWESDIQGLQEEGAVIFHGGEEKNF